jgi:type IV pilus assembly protein PilX
MAGNTRDVDLAFQAAEASVRNAEKYLAGLTAQPTPCLVAPCIVFQTNALPLDLSNQPDGWWSKATTGAGTEYGVAGVREMTSTIEDPRFAIEEAEIVWDDITEGNGPKSGKVFYRITGRAKGTAKQSIAVIHTTYARRY